MASTYMSFSLSCEGTFNGSLTPCEVVIDAEVPFLFIDSFKFEEASVGAEFVSLESIS